MSLIRRIKGGLYSAWRRSHLRAVTMGVRLGRLTPAQVQAITDAHYASNDALGHDYGSSEYITSGLFDWEQAAIKAHFPPRGRVYVYAAGAGREMLALARMGYDVTGCECNQRLIDVANPLLAREGVDARIAYVAADDIQLPDEQYNAVIVGWSSYAHIQRREKRIELLRALAKVTAPGTPLLMSFHTREGVSFPFATMAKVANLLRSARGASRIETGDTLGEFFMHRFTRKEAASELRAAGFEMIDYGQPTSTAYAVARRI